MERFRDFIYKKNDIIVALVILVVALVIISSRVAAIMDYPKEMLSQHTSPTVTEQEADDKEN